MLQPNDVKETKQQSTMARLIFCLERMFFFNRFGSLVWALCGTVPMAVYFGKISQKILTNGTPFTIIRGLQIGNMVMNVFLTMAVPLVLNRLYAWATNLVTNSQLKRPRYLALLVVMALTKIGMFIVSIFTMFRSHQQGIRFLKQ